MNIRQVFAASTEIRGSKTSSEQKALLEESTNREVFDQVQDDSSSLIVLRDTASYFSGGTQSTEQSSKFSMKFRFDAEIMGSRVYQRAVRSLFRRRGRQYEKTNRTSTMSQPVNPYLSQRFKLSNSKSKEIDAILEEDARKRRKTCKILMVGGPSSGVHVTLERMILLDRLENIPQERLSYREKIQSTVLDDLSPILDECKLDSVAKSHSTNLETLIQHILHQYQGSIDGRLASSQAIFRVWQDNTKHMDLRSMHTMGSFST